MSGASPSVSLLILGLGNPLCGDDGLGPVAVARLAKRYAPGPGVEIVDGGTLGLALLSELEGARKVILVDAVRTGDPPGSPVRVEGEEIEQVARHRLSPHQIGVADLLQAARVTGCLPDRLVLLGVVPETIELGLGCSPAVEAALPDLIRRITAEAADLGHPLSPEDGDATAGVARERVASDALVGGL